MLAFWRVLLSLLGLASIVMFLYYVMPVMLESPPHGVFLAIDNHPVLDMRMNRPEESEPDPQQKVEVLAGYKVKITTIFYSAAGLNNLSFGASLDGKEIPVEANLSSDPNLMDAVDFKIQAPSLPVESVAPIPHKIRVWAIDRSRNLRSNDIFGYILPVASDLVFRIDKVADIAVDRENIVGQFIDPNVSIEASLLRDNLKIADDYEAVCVLTPKYNPEFEKKRAEAKKKGAKEPTPEEEAAEKMKIYEILLGKPVLADDNEGKLALGKITLTKVYSDTVGRYSITFKNIQLGGDDDFDRRFLIHLILVRKDALATLQNDLANCERVGDLLDDTALKGKIIMVNDGVEVHRKPKPVTPAEEAAAKAKAEAAAAPAQPAKTGATAPAKAETKPVAPAPAAEKKTTTGSKPAKGTGFQGIGEVNWK
jgi:hypothetical protein